MEVCDKPKLVAILKVKATEDAVTLTLELPANKEEALSALARAEGVSAKQFVYRIVARELERQEEAIVSPAKRRISERIAEIMADVPR